MLHRELWNDLSMIGRHLYSRFRRRRVVRTRRPTLAERVADGTHQGLIFPGGDLVHAMLAFPY